MRQLDVTAGGLMKVFQRQLEWKTCCTLLNKAMPFESNTFYPPWTLKCHFPIIFPRQPPHLRLSHTRTPFFLFPLVLPESLFELASHFYEVVGCSTSPVAPLRSGEATRALILLLVLSSGSPLMSADCLGGVSTTAVQLYSKILQ